VKLTLIFVGNPQIVICISVIYIDPYCFFIFLYGLSKLSLTMTVVYQATPASQEENEDQERRDRNDGR